MSPNPTDNLDELIARHEDGHPLERPFYCEPWIFRVDVERVVSRLWHLVDHVSRIPRAGDFFTCEIAGESIIVVRGKDAEIRAFFNVCRHRGSRVCRETQGSARVLVCPYHAWTYDLDGSLKSAAMTYDGFDKSRHGLVPCHLKVSEGLIFICLSQGPSPDFDAMLTPALLPFLRIQDLPNACIAHRATIPTGGNWKLVVENFFECNHCLPAHPEYCSIHPREFILALSGDGGQEPNEHYKAFQPEVDAFEAKAAALGHPYGEVPGDPLTLHFSRGDRFPMKQGMLSETQDGKPAAPLMGAYRDWDGGTTGIILSPLSIFMATNDFVTLVRFIPRHETLTDVEAIWLVRGDAQEGKDYDLARMTWMWDVTLRQDKRIIEDNQAGVRSRAYTPGPYTRQEKNANRAVQWYLNLLRQPT
jgi:phenylpropionate dioxygenase-like ring-hydroxylating dioxygenase large terminal subunit